MKKFIGNSVFTFLFIFCIFLLVGCHHDMLVGPVDSYVPPVQLEKISLVVNNKTLSVTDTAKIALNTNIIMRAVSNSTAIIVNWQWIFADSSRFSGDSIIYKKFTGISGSLTAVRLTATTSTGTSYSVIRFLRLTTNGSYDIVIPPVVPIDQVTATMTIYFRKEPSNIFSGFNYFGTGDQNGWSFTYLAKEDTSWWVDQDANTYTPTTQMAPWVRYKFTITKRTYHLGFGKYVTGKPDPNDNGPKWASYFSPYCSGTDIGFTVGDDWSIKSIAPNQSPVLPGYLGDFGDSASVRFTPLSDRLLIYINNFQDVALINPFIRLQSPGTGNFTNPLPQATVSQYANWGVVAIKYTDMPSNRILMFRKGIQISAPDIYSTKGQSLFLEPMYGVYKIQVLDVATPNRMRIHIIHRVSSEK